MKHFIRCLSLGICISFSGVLLGSVQPCSPTQPVVVAYGNGIRTTRTQAEYELAYLQEQLASRQNGNNSNGVAFCLVYDGDYTASVASAFGPLGSLIQPLLQFLQSAVQIGIQDPQQFWGWLSNSSVAPPEFNQLEQDIGLAIGVGVSTILQPDIFDQLTIYQTALFQNHQSVIVVAHSQGNLYVNQAYGLLFPSTASPGIGQFKVVAVATPATYVAGGGPYTTLTRDPISLLVDLTTNTLALPPNTDNGPCVEVADDGSVECFQLPFHSAYHDFTKSYIDGSVSGPQILNEIISDIPGICPPNVTDDFDRPDGVVGNGWANTTGNVNGNLVIVNGALSTSSTDGQAGVYRLISLSGPVTVSATLTQENGFGGLLKRYGVGVRFGSDGSLVSGYGINFHRGDETFADSNVSLILNGATLASLPSSFQFGASITTTITFNPDGTITGSVFGDGSTFNFTFGPRAVTLPGSNFAILEGFPDSRSAVITNPTVDNVTIAYGCNPPVVSHDEGLPTTRWTCEAPFTAPTTFTLQSVSVYLWVAAGQENNSVQGFVIDGGSNRLACTTDFKSASAWGASSANNGALTSIGGFQGAQCTLAQGNNYYFAVGTNSNAANYTACGGYSDGTVFYQIR
jgi:hypothetical protein